MSANPEDTRPSRDDILPYRTDKQRAADRYGHRRAPARSTAPEQEEGLFDPPEPCEKRFIEPERPDPRNLFPDLQPADRKLVQVDGWPDYRGDDGTA